MDKAKLIQGLNDDLAGELQAVVMYLTYAAKVSGPHRPALRQFFMAEIPDETGHAQFLADKICSLGGEPTSAPRKVPAAETSRQMLENVLKAEAQAISDYKKRAEQASEFGDKGLSTRLETIVEDETTHYEETLKILKGWE
ncbi:MAG: ferritin-like domain-containing protein [Fimbriimonadaceae bacterium]|nr:ferritin-like domain-containing protein [Fimbriimonadaceae bacterium]